MWQAPAEGGIPRYMMIFGENQPTDVGPVRSSRYYYIAWASEWKAVYAHAGGSPQAMATLLAQGNGKLVYNADEFRWAGYVPADQQPVRAAQPVHHGQAAPVGSPAGWAPSRSRPAGLEVRARCPARATAGRRPDHLRLSDQTSIRYDYDRDSNTYLRSVTDEGDQIDAATKLRVAPKNVIVMLMSFGPLNDGHPAKHRLEAQGRRQRPGLDLDQRQDDQGDLAQEARSALRRSSTTAPATKSR